VKYSVIFLLERHNEDLLHYLDTLTKAMRERHESFEIIIIAKGTGSFLKNMPYRLHVSHKIKAFEMSNKSSQAMCLKSGFKESSGDIIFVCGSYQHLTEKSYGHLLDSINDGTDIISVWRQNRCISSMYRFQSYLFRTLIRWITGMNLHDLGCNVFAFRREVMEKTELYGNMYRYFPIYAARKGFKHKEVACEPYTIHEQPHEAREGFYDISVYMNKVIDIFTLYFNTSFSKKPLRFFISMGLSFIVIGFVITSFIFSQKFFQGYPVGNRPLLLVSLFFIIIGIQSASVGLLGEIIVFTNGRKKKEFVIEKII
jgi:hypothetical protein